MSEEHQQHGEDHTKHLLLLGAAGAAGSVILAPYVLPFLGIGDGHTAHMMMSFIGGEAGPGFYGSGIAGTLQKGIASLPFVGGALTSTAPVTIPGIGVTLAAGALTTILASAVIGIGGMLLANWMEKREKPSDKIHWSKIIRAVSLTTSILISLPSILTGISIGITFLANLMNTQWGNRVAYAMGGDYGLGATSMAAGSAGGAGAVSGLMAVLPHLFTCGSALLPVMIAMFMGKKHEGHDASTHLLAGMGPEGANTTTAVELVNASPTIAGQPCNVAFRLIDKTTGKSLDPNDLELKHTKKIHTMIVDHSLNDYHHVHPEYDAQSGLFVTSFTPTSQQPYSVWNDFTRTGNEQSTALKVELPHSNGYEIPPNITHTQTASADGLTMHIETAQPLEAGKAAMVTFRVTDSTGHVVTNLESIMGAYAHLAGFSKDGERFIHCHPMGAESQSEAERGNGILQFHIQPEWAGLTKFFIQVRHNGHDVTIPFGQYIQPQEKFSARPVEMSHHGMSHAGA